MQDIEQIVPAAHGWVARHSWLLDDDLVTDYYPVVGWAPSGGAIIYDREEGIVSTTRSLADFGEFHVFYAPAHFEGEPPVDRKYLQKAEARWDAKWNRKRESAELVTSPGRE